MFVTRTRKAILRGSHAFGRQRVFSRGFLNGANAVYAERMLENWSKDPASVHPSWAAYFETGGGFTTPQPGMTVTPSASVPSRAEDAWKQASISRLLHAYQFNGHYKADLDPLKLNLQTRNRGIPTTMDYKHWGFTEADMDSPIYVASSPLVNMLQKLKDENGCVTLRQVIDHCEEVYCGTIGYEYMHISSSEKCNFLRQMIEVEPEPFDAYEKKMILREMGRANGFENFLNLKYAAQKRFGLDGVESMIVSLKGIINEATDMGVEDFVVGMPHRGRLNVLANVVRKPIQQIFHEFAGNAEPSQQAGGSGDVKYHLGASHDRLAGRDNDQLIHITLAANPSHLETVDPVVLGKTRAKMHYKGDADGNTTMAILLHGDAAFAGQGVVYETMSFADLPDYHTGGTVHIIANNQIGFTTDPYNARSSPYCTAVAKSFEVPVFHVNAEDPEAVLRVAHIAAKYRQKFHQDVVIDLIGYRKYGHNEGDEPGFTQPLMYKAVKQEKGAYLNYSNKLIAEGVVTQDYVDQINNEISEHYSEAFEESKTWGVKVSDWLDSRWKGFGQGPMSSVLKTGLKEEDWNMCAQALSASQIPQDFTLHRGVKKVIQKRQEEVTTGENILWGTAEAMAFASLLREGCHVRLSGQDCERGTFSHRHAVLHEQKNVSVDSRPQFRPLEHVPGAAADFSVCNSSLSEYGVLGFDLGYSLESPHALVLWEAQFGDFANGAQVIFDTYVVAGESKWVRMSGLVCLLPHGYEGAGPEHSSCRIERFLQSVDDDPYTIPEIDERTHVQVSNTNIQVCNISTPANYFHVLRRQIHRNFRKPLIIATPKFLLRYKNCVSKKEDMVGDSRFHRVIEDDGATIGNVNDVQRLILCSGKIYYELDELRKSHNLTNLAITRIEQIAPFPFDRVLQELQRFPNADLMWAQEEPMNMGCWSYIEPRVGTCLRELGDSRKIVYNGRDPAAAPATGFPKMHKAQVNLINTKAVEGLV